MSLAHSGRRVTALAGGVGGAKLAQGLARVVPGENLTVIVNTADDFELYGLNISPDLDTVMYTLAGIANPIFGWGIDGDTQATLGSMKRLGENTWFLLGDQDFATHILRTHRLRSGESLTAITADFARALGIGARMIPMTDQTVSTLVDTPAGRLGFQDYFVARHQSDDVTGVVFDGIDDAAPAAGVIEAIGEADILVINPSNPIVSIGPILAVPGVRAALAESSAKRVGVSPIIGGKALKGPADKMLETLGHEVSALGIARIYAGLLDLLVIDEQDRDLQGAIEALGIRVLITNSIMGDAEDRERLAREILAATEALTGVAR
ncbi:MAG TPA: 2-phospho-L-lactate transferase [Thermomicrobiales bacterium]|nr:2-phospho-L-lactate transferase [Thermomicrobiales bacterium]